MADALHPTGSASIHRVIIDTDPGQDDMLAILMAAMSENIEIVAVTAVSGNAPVEHTTQNALNILEAVGLDVPVFAGAANPLIHRYGYPHQFHGVTGLGSVGKAFRNSDKPSERIHAAQAIIDIVVAEPGGITILALAPMTNLALALMMRPDIGPLIKSILFMGGGLDRGNVTAAAEFNIWADAEAATLVFQAGIPLIMFGLNVTERAVLPLAEVKRVSKAVGPQNAVVDATRFYFETYFKFVGPGASGAPIHDICPVAHLIDPGIFVFEDLPVEVITTLGPAYGMTLADRRNRNPATDDRRRNVRVAVDADFDRVASLTAAALQWGAEQQRP